MKELDMFYYTISKIFLFLFLFIGLTGTLLNPSPATGFHKREEEMYPIFLPIVVMPPIVEHIVLSEGKSIGYPGYVWALGYINSVVPQPLYSVSIEVKFLYYPYCDPVDPDPCGEPFELSEIVHPGFPATLPGQVNPFFWERMLTKDDAFFRQVKVLSASLKNESGKTYYPLTVLNWHRENKAVIGRVRNDSGKNLVDARVVVFSNQCYWKDATLIQTGLQPGQETDFLLDYCEEVDVVVVGQGSASP
jgi:hypothetical protein